MANDVGFSLGGAPRASFPRPSKPANGVKRTHAVALDDESDDEHEIAGTETITHFSKSEGGGFDASRPKEVKAGPLVIEPQANKRWQDARQNGSGSKRQKNGLPGPDQRDTSRAEEQEAAAMANRPKHGLNIQKAEQVNKTHPEAVATAAVGDSETITEDAAPARERTLDEIALDRLRGVEEKSTLVLPALTEEQAFQRDFRDAPDQASAADYDRVPVEEFGAALLRGMGWKEGMGIGNQKGKKIVESKFAERRAPLLGIGAKQDAAVAAELGTWGHGDRRKRAEAGGGYNPVVLRNRKTGQEMSEVEMQNQLRTQKEQKGRSRRDESDDEYERRRADRRRREERDRDRDRDRDGHRSSRRDRSAGDRYSRSKGDDRRDRRDERHKDTDRRRERDDDYDRDRRDRHGRGR